MRLKRFLEMRGADAGALAAALRAAGALGRAALRREALDGASALIADWTEEERQALRASVPRHGLNAPFRDGTVRGIAREMVALAQGGLARRARRDLFGKDEGKYLAPLAEIVETGRSASDRLLADYRGPWEGDIDKVFTTAVL